MSTCAPSRTLVVNLTRFGDLLQTQPVLTGLAGEGGVGMVCLENFGSATSLLRDTESCFPFPGASLLAGLSRQWSTAAAGFWQWGREVRDGFGPCRVINLTPSLTGRLLGRFLARDTTAGFGLDPFGFSVSDSPWAAFFQIASSRRLTSPFNIVDLFRRVAGLPPAEGHFRLADPTTADLEAAKALLDSQIPKEARGLVGFQLGASEARRRWPLEHFIALGERLWETMSILPVLLGSGAEKTLGERYAASAGHPFVDMIGRTDFQTLAATVSRLELLVTNDTGTMHLAAGLGVPIAAVFLATAQPWDTGPYGAGHLSLEPALDCHPCEFGASCDRKNACRGSIAPDTLFRAVQNRLREGRWPEIPPGEARGWVSRVDEHGYLDLESVSGLESEDRTVWVRVQRGVYRQFLDEKPLDSLPVSTGDARLSPDLAARLTRILEESGGLLAVLEGQGRLLAQAPLPRIKTKFLATWQHLQTHLAREPHLALLSDMWAFESQEQGRDMANLTALTLRYRELIAAMRRAM